MAHYSDKTLVWTAKQPAVKEDNVPAEPLSTASPTVPSLFGVPLKYISLVTLAVQNASLTLLMHYSRVSTPPDQTYSAGSAVLATELLKGLISLVIAFSRLDTTSPSHTLSLAPQQKFASALNPRVFFSRCRRLGKEVFRPDCWKLSIPAILYVIQNNLQFVAASNLEAATFQVTYQMKILTTAAFSVVLLRKKLTPLKWVALFFLALGVGIVQIQCGVSKGGDSSSSAASGAHVMDPIRGFLAVAAACFTSGLAGVYFEMVLKNTSGDLWVRNVQLSLFSLLPALVPIILAPSSSPDTPAHSVPSLSHIFANFTPWAWATVLTQVLGGLITALVIKYADNIMKGFATSLSIVLSFLASAGLFHLPITAPFVVGASVVLCATWLYSQPDTKKVPFFRSRRSSDAAVLLPLSSRNASSSSLSSSPRPRVAHIHTPSASTSASSSPAATFASVHHHHHQTSGQLSLLPSIGRRTPPSSSPTTSPTTPTSEYERVLGGEAGAPLIEVVTPGGLSVPVPPVTRSVSMPTISAGGLSMTVGGKEERSVVDV